jgi:hypothetical protein
MVEPSAIIIPLSWGISMDTEQIIAFWSAVSTQAPYLHSADADALSRAGINLEEHGIYPSLFPQPWVGPIKKAQAFLLQLNPGFSGPEVEIEQSNSDFRTALRDNLSGETPNLFLDSRFVNHPGRRWVESHLRGIAPIEDLSTKVAQIELFPYHSEKFVFPSRVRRILFELPSVRAIRDWVHNELKPAAVRNEIAVVVQRSSKQWGFTSDQESHSVVIYRGAECQGGWVTPRTRGGQLIMRHLSS